MEKMIILMFLTAMLFALCAVVSLAIYSLTGSTSIPGPVTVVFGAGMVLAGVGMFGLIFVEVLTS